MAEEAWAEVWREPDGHWRWRYVELDDGLPRLVLPSAEYYANRRVAAEAASTAYPGIRVRRLYPRGQAGTAGRQRGRDGRRREDLGDGHRRGHRRARHRLARGSARRQRRGRGAGRRARRGAAGGLIERALKLARLAGFVLAAALLSKLLGALLRSARPRRRRGTRDPDPG